METSEAAKKMTKEHGYLPLIVTSVEKTSESCTDSTSDTSFQSRTLSLGSESNDKKSSLERSEIPRNTSQDICQIPIICFFVLCHEWVTSKNITISFSANNVLVSLTFLISIHRPRDNTLGCIYKSGKDTQTSVHHLLNWHCLFAGTKCNSNQLKTHWTTGHRRRKHREHQWETLIVRPLCSSRFLPPLT